MIEKHKEAALKQPVWLLLNQDDWIRESIFNRSETMSAREIKSGAMIGGIVVDDDGKIWRISSIVDLGIKGGVMKSIIAFLGFNVLHNIKYDMESVPGDGLSMVKKRICNWISNFTYLWLDEHMYNEKLDLPYDVEKLTKFYVDKVCDSSSLDQIWKVVNNPFQDIDWNSMVSYNS